VLAQRVVRALLDGAPPDRLLCLTFTKAAAANMAERVFQTLARWTLLDDEALSAAIAETGARAPSRLDGARALFARAVDTPGGLKIQTIHAFCERLLHLFPFEANVPADFAVLDDALRAQLLAQAQAEALADPLAAQLGDETGADGFGKALQEMLRALPQMEAPARQDANLRQALGLAEGETEETLTQAIFHAGPGAQRLRDWAAAFASGSAKDAEKAAALHAFSAQPEMEAARAAYLDLFFTKSGDIRKTLATKAVLKVGPGLEEALAHEALRLQGLLEKLKAARAFARTQILTRTAHDIAARFAAKKRARGLLDYEDLILSARDLLRRSGAAAWALYKLDGGVDQILVDEAQDTSAAQWEILSALASEFYAGHGRPARGARAFFAVGDEKQSIFSFQGAAPAEFQRMRRFFENRAHDAQKPFHHVRLELSFRSAPEILQAVDHVFAHADARRGLVAPGEPAPEHLALKRDLAGLVEIWPPLCVDSPEAPGEWSAPLDLPRESDAAAELARRIAARIARMIAPQSRERVGPPEAMRPIRAGDVMILVRRRDALFNHLMRTLKDAGVPVAGADRLDIAGHIATQDLVAAMRASLSPQDDLALASVLKSPLIGLDDEALMNLAPLRAGALAEALALAPRYQEAAQKIARWRALAETARPFEFLSHLLDAEGGRRKMLGRLGPEAADALDELMAFALRFEQDAPPSLLAFAEEVAALELSLKRDLDSAGDTVRVMTVHASKGLESKIVFLPDACSARAAQHGPSVFSIGPHNAPAFVWSARKEDDVSIIAKARQDAQDLADEEYRRLLYVAMTRAEERLYVSGWHGARAPAPDCWHALISAGLAPYATQLSIDEWPEGEIMRFGAARVSDALAERVSESARAPLPDWVSRAAAPELGSVLLRPSHAVFQTDLAPALPSPLEAADAHAFMAAPIERAQPRRTRGLLIHALLQSLPDLPADHRRQAADSFLRTQAPEIGARGRARLVGEALSLISAPALAPFFSVSAQAEVALAAQIERPGATAIDVVGRIDRLTEYGNEVWIADFKTGAPRVTEDAITQLALYAQAVSRIYAGRTVRAFVIFTRTAQMQEIDLGAALTKTLAPEQLALF
jgi:ATP-dependent helicase/nuclease subunit A